MPAITTAMKIRFVTRERSVDSTDDTCDPKPPPPTAPPPPSPRVTEFSRPENRELADASAQFWASRGERVTFVPAGSAMACCQTVPDAAANLRAYCACHCGEKYRSRISRWNAGENSNDAAQRFSRYSWQLSSPVAQGPALSSST